MGKTFEDIALAKDFLNKTQIAQEIIVRINKWDYIKLMRFSSQKKQLTEGGKNFLAIP